MARKNRSLTSFADTSYDAGRPANSPKINHTIENKNNIEDKNNNNSNINNNVKTGSKLLDNILSEGKTETIKPTAVYFDPKVKQVLDSLTGLNQGRNGKRSKLVNEILKEFFISEGLMKKDDNE
ncbi:MULTISPECIES: hypothetical protein [Bacillus]|uniref:hypothetical protein n=1 Tax=Bacillus TaxID=1386 RepID=UPI000E54B8BF|nr:MULTISPECIES: hypothetical protein [Bacillus]MBT3123373.1 hypothetical protein [Bacillus inaquosorum]MCB4341337.1 hypothetical protein [Bacillus subtilis]MCB5337152.1 hypothetical protein [Bacillus amyloliquefaciens]MCF7615479.1 hypothetical protein [Bacillus subtilis]MCH4866840.1 hypothetical protein [Bacillus sp. 1006-3]